MKHAASILLFLMALDPVPMYAMTMSQPSRYLNGTELRLQWPRVEGAIAYRIEPCDNATGRCTTGINISSDRYTGCGESMCSVGFDEPITRSREMRWQVRAWDGTAYSLPVQELRITCEGAGQGCPCALYPGCPP
jgi:hypothetical protein